MDLKSGGIISTSMTHLGNYHNKLVWQGRGRGQTTIPESCFSWNTQHPPSNRSNGGWRRGDHDLRWPHKMLLMAHAHCTGQGQGLDWERWVSVLCYVLYPLHRYRDRDREPLFSIVRIPVPVPVPVLIPIPCSVYEPLPSYIQSNMQISEHGLNLRFHSEITCWLEYRSTFSWCC